MATYVYQTADGVLVSWSPDDDAQVDGQLLLAQRGLQSVSGLASLDDSHKWDEATKTVISVTPPPAAKPIATGTWILRFTPQEFQAITSSTDPVVQQFLFALNHTTQIDLSTATFTNGVAYLVSVNLLAQDRVAAILAGA